MTTHPAPSARFAAFLTLLAALPLGGCEGLVHEPGAERPEAPGETPRDPGAPGEEGPPTLGTEESTPPPARVVRLDARGYASGLRQLLAGRDAEETTLPAGVRDPFGWVDPNARFSTESRSYRIDASTFETLVANARVIAPLYREALPADVCDAPLDAERCQRRILAAAGERLFRRPPSELELDEAMALTGPEPRTPEAMLDERLTSLLLSPHFLFRPELGQDGAPGSVQPLDAYELASALSFTLVGHPPDEALFAAARDGSLTRDDVLEAQARRLMTQPGHRARVARFVRELFRYAEAESVAKDERPADVFPEGTEGARDARYRPERFVEETDLLVEALVEDARHEAFIAELLTTERAFVRESTAIFYNTTSSSGEPEEVRLDGAKRRGLLMQPAWLVAFSETDHNSPIRRGLFIQESLLCGDVPDIPIDDVPLLDFEGRTLREALADHTEVSSCYGCHQYMDPLGLPFEQFDHFGRFRTEEAGAPVDTSGELRWSEGALADALVDGPQPLVDRLARSPEVTHCVLSHALRFYLGRAATAGDGRALTRAREAYEASGGDFDEALVALVLSESFRSRTLPR